MKELPKNIRQIGNVSDSTKVYIEDYVDTYINQLRTRTEIEIQGIFFVGEITKEKTEEYFIVSGAILMQDIKLEGSHIICGKDTWRKACKEAKESFEGKNIIGWAIIKDGIDRKLSPQIAKLDERFFTKKNRLLMLVDVNEKEEALYVYRFNSLMEMQGYFVYYEKNQLMQEYMIARRKESALPPSEAYEDRATKDFRNIINQKTQAKQSEGFAKRIQFSGVASVIALVAIGIIGMNQYESLQSLGSNLLGTFSKTPSNDEEEVTQVVDQNHLLTDQLVLNKPDIVDDDIGELDDMVQDNEIADNKNTIIEDTDDVKESGEVLSDLVQETTIEIEYITYTVEAGDTLASICRMYYGDMGRVKEICEVNDIDTQDFIVVGEVLKIPKL